MPHIQPSLPKGCRDFLPQQMLRRHFVINTIRNIFEKYGYEPLETPSIEKLEVLSGKYGEEGEQLIFKVLRRGTGLEKLRREGGEFVVRDYSELVEEALRYDLTVPLSRVVAMYQNQLLFPFKRYQIQPVWRADRPQRGRYREFYQCDVDVVGTESMLADAETIAIVYDVLATLGFEQFKIRINNRKILNGLLTHAGIPSELGNAVFVAIDKLDKIGLDGVRKELGERGLAEPAIQKILSFLEISGAPEAIFGEITDLASDSGAIQEGVDELKQIFATLPALGVPETRCQVDLFLVRGLGYYTGPIHESVLEQPQMGSLTGGGRYDELVGMFLGRDIPATGTAFGIERIIDVMDELDMFPDTRTTTSVLVTLFDENTGDASLRFAQHLRSAGIPTETFFSLAKMKKQLTYANKKGIPFVAIIGPQEQERDEVTLKDMRSGEQQRLAPGAAVEFVKRRMVE